MHSSNSLAVVPLVVLLLEVLVVDVSPSPVDELVVVVVKLPVVVVDSLVVEISLVVVLVDSEPVVVDASPDDVEDDEVDGTSIVVSVVDVVLPPDV